jgi:NADPH:quinone reductase-like Zn-dependent oxidoreductase
MHFGTAASLPSNLVLAYYSLVMIGRLQKGESVLIHDSASALGQISIQMAQVIGADIFTTTSYEDRNLITSLYGIESSHVFEAESSQLSKSVRRLTRGQGVDLVLSSLPHDKLEYTWSAINPCKSIEVSLFRYLLTCD